MISLITMGIGSYQTCSTPVMLIKSLILSIMNKTILHHSLIAIITAGTVSHATPGSAQFTSNTEGCGTVCVKLDLQSGSSSNFNNFDSFGINNTSSGLNGNNNIRWQLGVTWRPTAPEVAQGEAERTKQRLDDNRSLMLALTEAIAQNKTELARGLAIILAPRLNYSDPKVLLAELKEGSVSRDTFNSNLPGEVVIELK
jgi:hypothetical protein